jgi:hypothetical protein
MLFQAVMKFCLDLLRSKFWLIGEWSNGGMVHSYKVQLSTASKEDQYPKFKGIKITSL